MQTKRLLGVLCLTVAGLCIAGCGGSSTLNPPLQKTTPVVTVTPTTPSVAAGQALLVTVSVSGTSGTPTGTVTLTSGSYTSAAISLTGGSASITIPANTLSVGTANLSATYTPDAGSSSIYTGAPGTNSVTVAALMPAVSVSPGSSSLTTAQALTVTVAVSGSGATPTGSVILTSGSYASAATALTNGSATITIPAGSLAAGNDTLTANYTPDAISSSTYSSGSGTGSVTVSAASTLITPTVTVSPNPSSITTAATTSRQIIPYSCVGSLGPGGSDASNITSLFLSSGAGAQVKLNGQNCTANSTIVWGSQQSLNIDNATLTCNLPAGPCTANTSYSTPTTKSFTCALTPGSANANCPSASFSPANDVNESFSCQHALSSTVDLHTSIALVNSGTSITLTDPVGSTITSGNFSCQETIRDQGWGLFANGGTIVNANAGGGGLYLQELILKSCNNCVVSGVNFVNPAGGSNWHTMIADVSNFTADGNTIISGPGYGQDGLHIFGPYQGVGVANTTLDSGDDGIVLDGGEYIGSGTILDINGAGHGVLITNTHGSDGSRCIAIFSECVNTSGSCVANLQSDIYIDGVYGLPGTQDGTDGCVQAVGIGVPNTASPLIDNIRIKNITNFQSPGNNRAYVDVSPSSGTGSGAGLMGNLSVEIPGDVSTVDATNNDAAVTLDDFNQDLTIDNLTVVAPNFFGPWLLLSESNSTGTYAVNHYCSDNLTPALYSWVTAPATTTRLTDSGSTNGGCLIWDSGSLPTSGTGGQNTTVTITVSGGSGNPTPTGSVSLQYGSLVLGSATLISGSAQFTVQASSLSIGSDTLTANYTPDANSSATYSSGSGTGSVRVSAPTLLTPAVTVSPNPSSITSTEGTTVTVTVSGASGTPTGSVTLTSGSYSSAATALSGGSATINIPAGSLAVGSDTLKATYTPDAAGAAVYASATGSAPVTVTQTYTLTIVPNGIPFTVSPPGVPTNNGGFTYNAGTQVTVTMPLSNQFEWWGGCPTLLGIVPSGPSPVCQLTMTSNVTLTEDYASITVTPDAATVGTQQLFTAAVSSNVGLSNSVTWSLSCPSCGNLSPGDFASTTSTSALYNTPYPAPGSVVVTATSTQYTSISGGVTVTLNQLATAAGPTLNVDVNTPNTPRENPHTINPYIYGINGYLLDSASLSTANFGLVRWGGDDTSRYNYQNGWSNSAADYYFENGNGSYAQFPNPTTSENFLQFFPAVDAAGVAALGTVPVNGYVSNGTNTCSFNKSAFPGQVSYVGNCGDGYYTVGTNGCTTSSGGYNSSVGGCSFSGSSTTWQTTSIQELPPDITQTSATPTSTQVPNPGSVTTAWADSTWSGAWVNSIVSNASYGNGASGKGVAMWDLDNEPTWWDAVHRDVHPLPFTYDEVTNNGIGTALAIKTADPTALIAGPVIDYWWGYFYSKKDIENGWSNGSPCWQPWSNPIDREAHGGVPMIEYYLQQFAKYSGASYYNTRLLDYVDIHGYFAPYYRGNSVGFTTAGDTQEQEARMNGTRVFWDPTYKDPNYPQPNYITDANHTTSCSVPAQAPQLIPMMQSWVSKDYPGTQTAIDEYNFGGLEAINGAVVQADILGIFGREGLGMSALWPTGANGQADSLSEKPGNFAFAMYRNYDGNDSTFGDTYLQATSTPSGGGDGQGQLAVYAAQRSSDNAITVVVINKTYGALTSTINLENFTAPSGTNAQVYQYSSGNLSAIVPQTAVSVTPPTGSGTTSTISYTFPAQSITLFVVPN